jgi:hypothetical protein
MTKRILAYLNSMPPAIAGQGGHNATFAVACALRIKFHLSTERALPYLQLYNRRCLPPWSNGELLHKLTSVPER